MRGEILPKITISSIQNEPFANKFGIVVHHSELECDVTIFDCYLQFRGQSEGSNPPRVFVRTIFSKLLNRISVQPKLV